MPKSDIRKRVREIWPNAWYDDQSPPAARQSTLVIIDAMQTLKGLSFFGKTWRELSDRMLADIHVARLYYPRATEFVYSFDKYPFVPLAKAPVQNERSARADVGEGVVADDDDDDDYELRRFQCGPLDEQVPDIWSRAVGDRGRCIPEIVRFFVKYWCAKRLADGITLYVDGHYMRPEDLEELEIPGAPEDVSDTELLKIPLKIQGAGRTLVPELRNGLGEGDFAMPFLMSKLAAGHDKAIVLSIDTDLMSILLQADAGLDVYWRFWPRLSFMPNTNGYGKMIAKNTQRWCEIATLRRDIEQDERLRALKNPVESLITACAASGGDYIDPIPLVTPQRFIDTLLINASFIGDVCDTEGHIDSSAHKRLLQCACAQAVKGNREKFEASKNTDFSRVSRLPNDPDILHRRRHLQYYMFMMRQAGQSVLALENPRLWGYARVDRTREIARDNIKRLHGTEAPDDAIEFATEPDAPESPTSDTARSPEDAEGDL